MLAFFVFVEPLVRSFVLPPSDVNLLLPRCTKRVANPRRGESCLPDIDMKKAPQGAFLCQFFPSPCYYFSMTDLHRATAHHCSIAGNDGQFFYWTVGNPQNTPLLCINGFTGTHSDLLAVARELKDDFYLIIPDLPGWGASDRLKESQTLNHYGKYLLELINHLQLKRVATLGHCMGAALSIEFAHMAPERSTH